MMHRASCLLGLAAVALMLVGPGGGRAGRAQEHNPADHLSDQLAKLVIVPSQPGDDDIGLVDGDWSNPDQALASLSLLLGTTPESLFPLPDDPLDPAGAAQDPSQAPEEIGNTASQVHRPATTSWSFDPDDSGAAAAPARPFVMDMPLELQTISDDEEAADATPAARSSEPFAFRISDRVKLKAQPTGGGLGGRVTLTFTFPTAY